MLPTAVLFAAASGCIAFAVRRREPRCDRGDRGAPAFAYAGVRSVPTLRVRTFVRMDGHGIDLIEKGPIAWDDVLGVHVGSAHLQRRLTVWREGDGADVEASVWLAAAPAEEVLGLIRSRSDVDIDVELD
jgi:hypothetical protein